jgi:hypothetical protein
VNFGLLLAWIGHSIESFALRNSGATRLPSVRCETHSRARDLEPPSRGALLRDSIWVVGSCGTKRGGSSGKEERRSLTNQT